MNVARLELCRELYELSGWTRTNIEDRGIRAAWRPTPLTSTSEYRLIEIAPNTPEDIPAYVAGYLLRKLPEVRLETWHDGHVVGKHFTGNGVPEKLERLGKVVVVEADTPEDALAKLAIELFKQGVLKREAA